jgi:ABC-type taurine transport system ATPase subunit
MELLEEPLASLSEENRQRVQENILKGWKEAEESTKESFEF